jgi:hypothetical protein
MTLVVINIFLGLWASFATVALWVTIKRLGKLVDVIEHHGEVIEETLDSLDEYYRQVTKLSQTEVASDDPVVRQIVRVVSMSKDVIEKAALDLAGSFDPDTIERSVEESTEKA